MQKYIHALFKNMHKFKSIHQIVVSKFLGFGLLDVRL